MVTGLATPKGYPVFPQNTMGDLNYQQQLTSIPPKFNEYGDYESPLSLSLIHISEPTRQP
jgi:hypothetical protein